MRPPTPLTPEIAWSTLDQNNINHLDTTFSAMFRGMRSVVRGWKLVRPVL
jgi:hypothetical protein